MVQPYYSYSPLIHLALHLSAALVVGDHYALMYHLLYFSLKTSACFVKMEENTKKEIELLKYWLSVLLKLQKQVSKNVLGARKILNS